MKNKSLCITWIRFYNNTYLMHTWGAMFPFTDKRKTSDSLVMHFSCFFCFSNSDCSFF